jgi:hypothetical protein
MPYIGAWERLPDALQRVAAANGLSEDEAKVCICKAVADRTVKIRTKLKRHMTKKLRASDTVLEGQALNIPSELGLADLDWEQSRPLRPWVVRRGSYDVPGLWSLEWIELSRTDVTNVLCQVGRQPDPEPLSKTSVKSKGRPLFDAAKRAIDALYPQGLPDPAVASDKILCWRVREKLKGLGILSISDDTILRAAGRRK